MKKTKKVLLGFLASVGMLCGSLGFAGCDFTSSSANESKSLQQLYSQYVVYVKVMGQEPLVYEEWLTMIKENANVGIEKVEIDEDGNLVITYTDGTTQTVEVPKEECEHSFGNWALSATGGEFCEEKLFFRTCADCGDIEWKQGSQADHNWSVVTTDPTCQAQGYDTKTCETCGKVEKENYTELADHNWSVVTTKPTCEEQGFDTKTCETCGKVEKVNYKPASHAWETTYSSDNSYHWIDCETCEEVKDKQEHSVQASGECSVCNELVGATEGVAYDLLSDGTAQVVMYEGTAKRVRIAETYQGAPVTKIANEAFKDTTITSIVIPDSVTSIGDNAFRSCTSLTSIEIPDSVTFIGDYAFIYCGSLTSVYITSIEAWCNISFANQSANPLYIVHNLYLNNELITELEIPDSVASIGEYAFSQYRSLISVTISEGISSIGDHAFAYCKSLTSVTIGDDVTSIGDYAFTDCSSLMSVTIGENVTSISSFAFRDCSSLQFNEYGNAKYLGSKTNDYFALIELKNKNFSSYTIHNDTKVIADGVFSNCSSLTSVYITDIEAWCNISFGGYSANPLSYAKNLYLNNELVTELEIPNTVTEIKDYAFWGCDSLTSVVIGDGVTSIGHSAFRECSSLTSITIGDNVTSIGHYAFDYCRSLTSVVIGDSVTSIGSGAFDYCDSLTSIEIPDSVTSIGDYAFYNCYKLTSIVIPDSVTTIGNYAFYGCSKLTSVYYKGTSSDWSNISIDYNNYDLTSAKRYYYSEQAPTTTGNWWRYDENGEVVVW